MNSAPPANQVQFTDSQADSKSTPAALYGQVDSPALDMRHLYLRAESIEVALRDLSSKEAAIRKLTRGLATTYSSLKVRLTDLVPKLEDLHARMTAEYAQIKTTNEMLRERLLTLETKCDLQAKSDESSIDEATKLKEELCAQHEDIIAMTGRCQEMEEAANSAKKKTALVWNISRTALVEAQQAAASELAAQKQTHAIEINVMRHQLAEATAALVDQATLRVDARRELTAEVALKLAAQKRNHDMEMAIVKRQLAQATAALAGSLSDEGLQASATPVD